MVLLAMIMVNVQVGLNDGTDSEISILGADISFVTSAFAQSTNPEVEEGDLSCDDHSNCQDGASCDGSGTHSGPCAFNCDKGPDIDCGFSSPK